MFKDNVFILIIGVAFALGWPHAGMAQVDNMTPKKISRRGYHLHGNIHSVLQGSFRISNNKAPSKIKKQRLTLETAFRIIFNKKGNLIVREYYKGNKLVKTEKFLYLKNGSLARRIVSSGKSSKQYWYVYDSQGNLIEMKLKTGNKLTKDMRYLSDGIEAIYDENGNLMKMDVPTVVRSRIRVIKVYGPDRKMRTKWLVRLNSMGQIIQKIYYIETGKQKFKKPQLAYGKMFIYNLRGDVKQIKKYQKGRLKTTQDFHYFYDSHQNWIQKPLKKMAGP